MIGKNILEAVKERNITHIRSALKGCINQDTNFSQGIYQEAVDYVINEGINKQQLFEVHDNDNLKPQMEWNKDYLNQLMADLLFNFSEERIEMIKKVGQHIYPVKVSNISSSSNNSSGHANSHKSKEKNFPLIAGVVGIIILVIILLLQILQK